MSNYRQEMSKRQVENSHQILHDGQFWLFGRSRRERCCPKIRRRRLLWRHEKRRPFVRERSSLGRKKTTNLDVEEILSYGADAGSTSWNLHKRAEGAGKAKEHLNLAQSTFFEGNFLSNSWNNGWRKNRPGSKVK